MGESWGAIKGLIACMEQHRKRPLLEVLAERLARALTPSETAILELAQVVLQDEDEGVQHKEASAGD